MQKLNIWTRRVRDIRATRQFLNSDDEGGALAMEIEKLWDQLDPETRQWLVDNPGCKILPRTVAAAIMKSTGTQVEQDRHGETVLSPSDCDFIREAAERADASRGASSTPRR
ncbi:hypothetical protein [Pseudarthrobacter sp. BRE9]|uniref:hypothetical protein n=1 Tax=Pseudarthrobacter sp. BRE9 TaxID=2962582 RepID=UPI002881F978|nr:hypothetical protein [Pseudarthrobacter sp. BRE9]MDT0168081.1 hypothetical protein [Pseudarthrobacter sp. BRE9]